MASTSAFRRVVSPNGMTIGAEISPEIPLYYNYNLYLIKANNSVLSVLKRISRQEFPPLLFLSNHHIIEQSYLSFQTFLYKEGLS